jgi:hypothetical protein
MALLAVLFLGMHYGVLATLATAHLCVPNAQGHQLEHQLNREDDVEGQI